MSLVFWDSNLFIYLLEGASREALLTKELRERMNQRGDQLCSSALTLGEVLVKPLQFGDVSRAQKYEKYIRAQVRLINFDPSVAVRFAEIRAAAGIKPADAIQLACAGHAGVDLFITNDDHLSHAKIRDVRFIASLRKVHTFLH